MGWYEAPRRPRDQKWTFHADYLFHRIGQPDRYIPASHPALVLLPKLRGVVYDIHEERVLREYR